jgi:serine/threonine protein kinase
MLTYKLPQKNDTPLAKGTILEGKYEIIEDTFDQGGFGRIYKARDINMEENRFYAIKEFYLNGEFKTNDNSGIFTTMNEVEHFAEKYIEMLRVRFFQEAMCLYYVTADRSSEGSIPRITSFVGHYEGRDYYVMDYIDGMTFREYIEEYGPLDEPTAIMLIKQVAHAMEQVHMHGIIHRDISPNNIILPHLFKGKRKPTPTQAVIVDFGNAKSFSSKATLNPSTMENRNELNQNLRIFAHEIEVEIEQRLEPLLDSLEDELPELEKATQSGTCFFTAPETLNGDRELDTYSLAATLYYILTGEYPNYKMFSKLYEMKTALLLRKHNVSEMTIMFLRDILQADCHRCYCMSDFRSHLLDSRSFDYEFVKKLNAEWIKSQN